MSKGVSREEFLEEIAIILEIEKSVLLEAKLSELEGFDSLGLIQIAITIEDLFGVKVSSDELLAFADVEELFSAVTSRRNLHIED